MSKQQDIYFINSISELLRELGLPAPLHPLVALVDYSRVPPECLLKGRKICIDFYKISFKREFKGQTKYGQGHYDFQEGGLAFVKPNQIVVSPDDAESYVGLALYFHSDLIRNYPLVKSISKYGFFSYEVSEALFLSSREKLIIAGLFASIADELETYIDAFSQDVLVSQIELLLNYSNRFYNRQFVTRRSVHNDMLSRLDMLLSVYFESGAGLKNGIPSVHRICNGLGLSQRYLSDMLRSLTGMNTRQYIQKAVIERAKVRLSASGLSVSEIAYELGFEHPQSLSKLFKEKTKLSPLAFRAGFN